MTSDTGLSCLFEYHRYPMRDSGVFSLPIGIGTEMLSYTVIIILISVFIMAKLLSIASLRELFVVLRRDA